jgi:hypothetical protein
MDQLAGIVAAVAAIGLLMCALRLRGLERKLSQLGERLRQLEEEQTKKTALL